MITNSSISPSDSHFHADTSEPIRKKRIKFCLGPMLKHPSQKINLQKLNHSCRTILQSNFSFQNCFHLDSTHNKSLITTFASSCVPIKKPNSTHIIFNLSSQLLESFCILIIQSSFVCFVVQYELNISRVRDCSEK